MLNNQKHNEVIKRRQKWNLIIIRPRAGTNYQMGPKMKSNSLLLQEMEIKQDQVEPAEHRWASPSGESTAQPSPQAHQTGSSGSSYLHSAAWSCEPGRSTIRKGQGCKYYHMKKVQDHLEMCKRASKAFLHVQIGIQQVVDICYVPCMLLCNLPSQALTSSSQHIPHNSSFCFGHMEAEFQQHPSLARSSSQALLPNTSPPRHPVSPSQTQGHRELGGGQPWRGQK